MGELAPRKIAGSVFPGFDEVLIGSYKNALRMVIEDVEAVRRDGMVLMHVNEAHPQIFNEPEFLETVRGVVRGRGARIHVNAGPLLLVPEMQGENGLRILGRDGVIDLTHRPCRTARGQETVVETEELPYRVYEEYTFGRFFHKIDFERATYLDINAHREKHPDKVNDKVKDKLETLRFWWSQSDREPPLLTTPDNLRELVEKVEYDEVYEFSYRYMDKGQLMMFDAGSPKTLRSADD